MTVYKKGTSKKWTAHISWTGQDGKRKRISKTGFRTKAEARVFEYGFLNYLKYNEDTEKSINNFLSQYVKNIAGNIVEAPETNMKPAYLAWDKIIRQVPWEEQILLTGDGGYNLLRDWQKLRCAMCGSDKKNLVLDHSHETGLVRGFLCTGCNFAEGKSGDNNNEWYIYRRIPPTKLLNIKIHYNEFGGAPYPTDTEIDRETVDAGVENWENNFCYELVKNFCDYRSSLDWASHEEMRTLVKKAFLHVRQETGVYLPTDFVIKSQQASSALSRYMNSGL
jgi:hypothetical protein